MNDFGGIQTLLSLAGDGRVFFAIELAVLRTGAVPLTRAAPVKVRQREDNGHCMHKPSCKRVLADQLQGE
ncbi:hypothetical protein DQX05_13340 [Paenibacillus thiaminolyticus]|uniref:Uncharacterized protein n=1 Tax=Paenibacillus thiaminolyticus TaxID=49283 RepID=A0A3A3H3A1_PANTH|nr:hypothetical protein DQX05_13340 [Paenibacillus thiaminolyticus]